MKLSWSAPAIDPDGLCSSVMMFSASCGPKISKSFLRRYRGAQGRERPGGVRGWPLRRGAANATRRDCTSHIPAKRVASGCPWACSAPGSVGSSLSLTACALGVPRSVHRASPGREYAAGTATQDPAPRAGWTRARTARFCDRRHLDVARHTPKLAQESRTW